MVWGGGVGAGTKMGEGELLLRLLLRLLRLLLRRRAVTGRRAAAPPCPSGRSRAA
jgi:hypothetical protein